MYFLGQNLFIYFFNYFFLLGTFNIILSLFYFVNKNKFFFTSRVLEIYSDQPGIQFNTGGRLPPYSIEEKPSGSPKSKTVEKKLEKKF